MTLQRFSGFLSRSRKSLAKPVADWFRTPSGQLLATIERAMLESQLARHFGSFIAHYNPPIDLPLAANIRHQISLGDRCLPLELYCVEDKWPIAAGTMDVVVLQHSLDFAVSPHAVLREAAQSVRAGGHLIIVGVHAWSLLGVYRHFNPSIWKHAYCLPPARITDWLTVLGFSLERRCFVAYRPLITAPSWQAKLSWLEEYGCAKKLPLGGCYMLVARKMVHGVHPQVQSLKVRVSKLQPSAVAAQTTHQSNFKHSEEHDR